MYRQLNIFLAIAIFLLAGAQGQVRPVQADQASYNRCISNSKVFHRNAIGNCNGQRANCEALCSGMTGTAYNVCNAGCYNTEVQCYNRARSQYQYNKNYCYRTN